MQFHFNGFRAGDPDIKPIGDSPAGADLPAELDVLIVGCGPAGLTLAAQLSAFPDISTRIVERKDGPMDKGQADGVSCRSMEMFEAFGVAHRFEREAYWVNETRFWQPDPADPARIARSGWVQDVEDGLSHMPHVILNQARVHDAYLDIMARSPNRLTPDYGWQVVDLRIADSGACPVTVTLEDGTGRRKSVQARYVVGCDGARSTVRRAIGRELQGESANQAWGVMDVLMVTDFPDIRCKTIIKAPGGGTVLIIPREGGYLVRTYVELDSLAPGERIADRNITIDALVARAQEAFQPYNFDVRDVVWWSAYQIGQRLTDTFDDVPHGAEETRNPRVFIAGDACHTHSPKAGQGMNVSMGDAFNLGWKLAAVLQGRAAPELLQSYSRERHGVARDLIDFDRDWARIISERADDDAADAPDFQHHFIKQGRYTAGVAVRYAPSALTGAADWQDLASGFEIGTRLHSAPVIRFHDARPMQLGQVIEADGRWRLFAFADRDRSRLGAFCDYWQSCEDAPVARYTPEGADRDAVFDLRAVLQQGHHDLEADVLPAALMPRKGLFGLQDFEKVFCPDLKAGKDIFDQRGIDRTAGGLVIVRPDQYVGHVLPLDAHDRLETYFSGLLARPR